MGAAVLVAGLPLALTASSARRTGDMDGPLPHAGPRNEPRPVMAASRLAARREAYPPGQSMGTKASSSSLSLAF